MQRNERPTGRQTQNTDLRPQPLTRLPAQGSVRKNEAVVRERQKKAVSGLSVFLVVMIAVTLVLLIVRSVNWVDLFTEEYYFPFSNEEGIAYSPDITKIEHDALTIRYEMRSYKDIYDGPCILVNPDHEYHFTEEDNVINVHDNKSNSYMTLSGSELLTPDTIRAIDAMMDDFFAETEKYTVMVSSGWLSLVGQQTVIDWRREQNGQKYVDDHMEQPGFSEHHTGYAFDMSVYEIYDDETSAMWQFDGKGDYFWINQNCEQYGIVLRYSASKEEITGKVYTPWHFRYVGKGNALAMTQMGMAMEEYVEEIKKYTFNGTRYSTYADNGDMYFIYYVPSDGSENQRIPIPTTADSCEISGNNIDGFIVAICYENDAK